MAVLQRATDMFCLSCPPPATKSKRSWVTASDGFHKSLAYFGKQVDALLCSLVLFRSHFLNFVCLVFCQLSPSLHKIKPFLSEPLVPRCSSGNTQPGLAAGLRTAHWTGLCRSADWAGEASLLPSSHHTQHLQGMTNSCEKRTEEGGERQDKHPKS